MAILQTSGPCHLWMSSDVDDGSTYSNSPLYLGTAEGAPFVDVTPHFTPLYCDISGQGMPHDYLWDGEEATIVADLNRWNEAVFAKYAARPKIGGTRGVYAAADIGTVMQAEGQTFDFWLQFPYAFKSPYVSEGMIGGYHFYSTIALGPDTITPGARAGKRRIICRAFRSYKVSDGTSRLYDSRMSGLPSVPPTGSDGATGSSS